MDRDRELLQVLKAAGDTRAFAAMGILLDHLMQKYGLDRVELNLADYKPGKLAALSYDNEKITLAQVEKDGIK